MYKLIFIGQYDPLLNENEVCHKLAQIYQTQDYQQFAHWFKGDEIILKTHITLAEAQTYQTVFASAGITINIIPIAPAHLTLPLQSVPQNSIARSLPAKPSLRQMLWKAYINTEGRLSYIDYLFWSLMLIPLIILSGIIFSIAFLFSFLLLLISKILWVIFITISSIIFGACLLFIICNLNGKRLRDFNVSAWWQLAIYITFFLIFGLIAYWFFSEMWSQQTTLADLFDFDTLSADDYMKVIAIFTTAALNVQPYLLIYNLTGLLVALLFCLPGQKQANRFGEAKIQHSSLRKIFATLMFIITLSQSFHTLWQTFHMADNIDSFFNDMTSVLATMKEDPTL